MKKVLLIMNIVLLSVLGISLISVHAAENQATAVIPVEQKIFADIPIEKIIDRKFDYILTAEKEDYPMPDGTMDGKYTFSVFGNDFKNISIRYTASGEYYYNLVQQEREDFEKNEPYRILVSVKNTDNRLMSQIIAYLPNGDKSDLIFTNTLIGESSKEISNGSQPIQESSRTVSEVSHVSEISSDNTLVNTGDYTYTEILTVISLAALLIATICLFGKNKKIN